MIHGAFYVSSVDSAADYDTLAELLALLTTLCPTAAHATACCHVLCLCRAAALLFISATTICLFQLAMMWKGCITRSYDCQTQRVHIAQVGRLLSSTLNLCATIPRHTSQWQTSDAQAGM